MKKLLVTGGTVFVSRYLAEFFEKSGYEVYVLNRDRRAQSQNVHLVHTDRHEIGEALRDTYFDVVIDTGYTKQDVEDLLEALGGFHDYFLISSSAVYPEDTPQPMKEESEIGENKIWKKYGTDKIEAEKILMRKFPGAYILRPPYLYGPMNNLYREAFIFDCALKGRKFYLPKDGEMKLQFFHINDLCKMIEQIMLKRPEQHIFNVGNPESISVKNWVELCYHVVCKNTLGSCSTNNTVEFVEVHDDLEQRNYFSFYNYEYCLDISKQKQILSNTTPMEDGLKESFEWYMNNQDKIDKRPYMEFIDKTWGRGKCSTFCNTGDGPHAISSL